MSKLKILMMIAAATGLMGLSIAKAGEEAKVPEAKNPFEKAIDDRFNAMDANKDRKIDYKEYTDSYQASLKSSFDKRDQNKDGALSKEEFMPQMGRPGTSRPNQSFQDAMQKKGAGQHPEKTSAEGKSFQGSK
jgi:Ca2+-binding EF-hand superfamily protein